MTVRTVDMPRVQRVLEGPGALGELPAEIERRGARRVVLLSGNSVAALPEVDALRTALGDRLVAAPTGVEAHNPSGSVEALVATAREAGADLLVALGGGSPVDAGKLVSFALGEGIERAADLEAAVGEPTPHGTPVPLVAVPTTLSAAEWNGLAGLTVEREQTKRGLHHPALSPAVVVLDPELAHHTPRELWTTTGVRALDHGVETVYARDAHPFGTGLALEALAMLADALPRSSGEPGDLEATLRCQQAAELSVLAVPTVSLGLSHAIGHQLGAAGVPHGVTSCVMLPHVMRFFAEAAPAAMTRIADALGGHGDASERLAALLDALAVPRTLRPFGVDEDSLDAIADATMTERDALAAAPRPVSRDDVRGLLADAL